MLWRHCWTVACLSIGSLALLLLSSCLHDATARMLTDEERRAGYAAANHTWPIPDHAFSPPTEGWIRVMRRRLRQMEALVSEDRVEKYDGWRSTVGQALVIPNFTQYGWAVTTSPRDLHLELAVTLRDQWHTAYGEGYDRAIVGDHEAVMVDVGAHLVERALLRLHPFVESWAGVPLQPIQGYGLRLYPNTSQLYMHLDKIETHIISCIFHIDRSENAQPWPLLIEDLEGTTQKVFLNLGDMLFYESSKCLHGRPIPFQGAWFTSLFLHYAPVGWLEQNVEVQAQTAIPHHWEQVRPYDQPNNPPRLVMADTAMFEPDCPNRWCGTEQTATWDGKAKWGVAISSHGTETKLNLPEYEQSGREEL